MSDKIRHAVSDFANIALCGQGICDIIDKINVLSSHVNCQECKDIIRNCQEYVYDEATKEWVKNDKHE